MKKTKVRRGVKYFYKAEICQMENITIKKLNELLIAHGYLIHFNKSQGISCEGYNSKTVYNTDKWSLAATAKGMAVIKKKSGSWNDGVYLYDYDKIKYIFNSSNLPEPIDTERLTETWNEEENISSVESYRKKINTNKYTDWAKRINEKRKT